MSFLYVVNISTVNLTLAIVGASLCLFSYILRLTIHIYIYKKQVEFSKIFFKYLVIFIFLGYAGWGVWSGVDPVKMNISSYISIPIGVILTVTGFGLFIYSEMKKGGVGEKEELVSTGIYSKIRHPMYVGIILFHIGYPFMFKSFIACLSTILWAAFIFTWKYFEEKNLERQFGKQYIEYKKKTWF